MTFTDFGQTIAILLLLVITWIDRRNLRKLELIEAKLREVRTQGTRTVADILELQNWLRRRGETWHEFNTVEEFLAWWDADHDD